MKITPGEAAETMDKTCDICGHPILEGQKTTIDINRNPADHLPALSRSAESRGLLTISQNASGKENEVD